jgi:hypothetical protein
VEYGRFQVALVELADEGARLTPANIVARLRLEPAEVERHLDRMTRDGQLDLDLDEDEGVVVYRVRGLSPRGGSRADTALASLEEAAVGRLSPSHLGAALRFKNYFRKGGAPLPASLQRSVARGVVLGGIFPGIGLAYAAPWPVVAVATLAVVGGFKVLAWISLLLAMPFLLAAAVISGVLGGLYTWQYNQMGRRAPLDVDPARPGQLPSRFKR